MKIGTVGEPYPGTELRLDPITNEIQTRHPGNFAGYWGKPDKTAETFTDDGFLMTGDVGERVDGTHIRIVDRIKHIIITSGGKNVSPSEIENVLKTSPYVKEAMVVGDGRKYLTALIGIELRHGRRLGAAPQHSVHDLPRPLGEARGRRADPGRRQRRRTRSSPPSSRSRSSA